VYKDRGCVSLYDTHNEVTSGMKKVLAIIRNRRDYLDNVREKGENRIT